MLVRRVSDLRNGELDVWWGNGRSVRLITTADGHPYSVTETTVEPGGESTLCYSRHVETCICVSGSGYVRVDGAEIPIVPGTLYAPGIGETHVLGSKTGMTLYCVFAPALNGNEAHRLEPGHPSGY